VDFQIISQIKLQWTVTIVTQFQYPKSTLAEDPYFRLLTYDKRSGEIKQGTVFHRIDTFYSVILEIVLITLHE